MQTTYSRKQGSRTIDTVMIAAGAALIAVCSWISIPLTVPFTLQTFAVFFLTVLLGGKRSAVSVLVYLLIGAAGIPVFAGFTSGIGILLGSTGGYMFGFLLIGPVYSIVTRLFGKKIPTEATALTVGLILCYAFGTAWFLFVYTRNSGAVAVGTVLSWCVLPFILPDLGKLALSMLLARRVRRAVPALSSQPENAD